MFGVFDIGAQIIKPINLTGELIDAARGITLPYWIQTGVLGVYLIWLCTFYVLSVRHEISG